MKYIRTKNKICELVVINDQKFLKRNNMIAPLIEDEDIEILKEADTIEELILPGDYIATDRGKVVRCKDTIFVNGKHYWSLHKITELYIPDDTGRYYEVAAYSRKTRKLVLL